MKITGIEIDIDGTKFVFTVDEVIGFRDQINNVLNGKEMVFGPSKITQPNINWNPLGPVTCATNDNGK